MRAFAFASLLVVLASTLAGCAECGEEEGRCDGEMTQVCVEEQWTDVVDCAAEGLTCEEECVAGQACCR